MQRVKQAIREKWIFVVIVMMAGLLLGWSAYRNQQLLVQRQEILNQFGELQAAKNQLATRLTEIKARMATGTDGNYDLLFFGVPGKKVEVAIQGTIYPIDKLIGAKIVVRGGRLEFLEEKAGAAATGKATPKRSAGKSSRTAKRPARRLPRRP